MPAEPAGRGPIRTSWRRCSYAFALSKPDAVPRADAHPSQRMSGRATACLDISRPILSGAPLVPVHPDRGELAQGGEQIIEAPPEPVERIVVALAAGAEVRERRLQP